MTRKERNLETLKKLNWMERKHKFNKNWNEQVKKAFTETKSYSFEELITRRKFDVSTLLEFKA